MKHCKKLIFAMNFWLPFLFSLPAKSQEQCLDANYKICNKPIFYNDANGNRTDYTYAPEHGGILTETGPPDVYGVRPQVRYSYSLLSGKYIDGNGVLQNYNPVYKLTKVSKCKVATVTNPASCIGTSDEAISLFYYDNPNLLLSSETKTNGDNSISQTIAYLYDAVGNIIVIDGPRTDVDDRAYKTYDSGRRLIFDIGVDSDGGGPLMRTVTKHTFDAAGNEIRVDYGYGNNTDGTDFAVSYFERKTYDSFNRLIKTEKVVP